MSNIRAKVYSELYEDAVATTLKAADAVPEGMRFKQASEGKAHPLWLMGHLAMTMDMLINNWMLGLDMEMPPEWSQTFGPTQFGGTPITTNPDDYPAWDAILDVYKSAGAKAAAKIATLDEEDFEKYALGAMPDQFKEFFGKLGKSIPDDAIHDAHHRGQMALLAGME